MDSTAHAVGRRDRLTLSAAIASPAVALVLVILKLWAFAVTGALSVAASLADSGVDLLVSGAALAAILYARRPPDADHAFGHASAEDLAALGQAVLMWVTAGAIGWAAVARLVAAKPPALAATGAGIAVMLVSIPLTLGLVLWQRRVVARTGNRVVAADALHYVGDLVPAIGAVLALWASSALGLHRIDAVVALAAAAILTVGAARIFKGAWDALMDRAADPARAARIERVIAGWPGIAGYHDFRTRQSGGRIFVNVHVELDGALTLKEAHAIGAALKRAILREVPESDVIIHKDPVERGKQTHGLDEGRVPDGIRDLFETASAKVPDQARGAPGADGPVRGQDRDC